MSDQSETQTEHSETVLIHERDGMSATYLLDDFDSGGFEVTRIVGDETRLHEKLTWNEIARGLRNQTMRIYDMTPDEVDSLE